MNAAAQAATQAAARALLATPQPLCPMRVQSGIEGLQHALGAHSALANLVLHSTQNTDGSDDNIPVAPEHMFALINAVNAQVLQHVNALKTLCQQAKAS